MDIENNCEHIKTFTMEVQSLFNNKKSIYYFTTFDYLLDFHREKCCGWLIDGNCNMCDFKCYDIYDHIQNNIECCCLIGYDKCCNKNTCQSHNKIFFCELNSLINSNINLNTQLITLKYD